MGSVVMLGEEGSETIVTKEVG